MHLLQYLRAVLERPARAAPTPHPTARCREMATAGVARPHAAIEVARLKPGGQFVRARAAFGAAVLVALAAIGAHMIFAEDAESTAQRDSGAGHAMVRTGATPPTVGRFSGTYQDGMPVYILPPIVVTGSRTPK
jgi:hypothetical protein